MKMKNLLIKLNFLLLFSIISIHLNAQSNGVAINAYNASADPSAILDVSSTSQGILIPEMTEADKLIIANPAVGLLVFQTDNTVGFWHYNGVQWIEGLGAIGAQGLVGNIGATGPAGATGSVGAQGINGNDGSAGPTGPIGAKGADGSQGAQGATGATGTAGADGENGVTGVIGATGAVGAVGATGATGVAGAAGVTGATGVTGLTGATGPTGISLRYIGESYGGGIVFYVDNTGEHGLIVSPVDMSNAYQWSNINNVAIGNAAKSFWDGQSNTNAIISQSGHTNSAAALCASYTGGGFNDWYLPSMNEFNMIFNERYIINKVLGTNGLHVEIYWTSNESSATSTYRYAVHGSQSGGVLNTNTKETLYGVRAVRRF